MSVNKAPTFKPPVYLFKKLGRYLGISTVSGDFYDLSPSTYAALQQWNNELSGCKARPSPRTVRRLTQKYRIPQHIVDLFPLPVHTLHFKERSSARCFTDITLNLTSRCNLRCNYCWNDQGTYSNSTFQKDRTSVSAGCVKDSEMPIEVARKAVDILIGSCGDDKDLVVDFYGGEPLLNLKTLLATVDYCRKNQKRWGVNFHFLLATNGTLLTPKIAGILLKKGVQIAVSIDGSKKVHDRNRPFTSGKGSFNTIRKNLKEMPEGIMKRLVGRTTVTPFYSDLSSLYGNLRKLGFERIELFESEDACHRLTPQRERFFFSTARQYRLLCRQYERLAKRYITDTLSGFLDYRKTFFNRFFKLMQRLYYHHEVTGGCPAGVGQFAIDASGGIYPCTSFLGVEKFRLGNIYNGLEEKKLGVFLKTIRKRFEHCRGCLLFSLCRTTGSCLNINYYFNRDPALPYQKSCELFREKMELAIATLSILSEKIPERLEELFGFDPVGRRGNKLY
ncbi:MAG: radical SAM protein [Candidatus Omnitrophica bacterium]|nr:radical SAM protein [Candidatus Omnitrophota bacterium]MDD5027226.1 radical SAM protein [Candidatus Omnitrophota bacterium]MDD5661628.1 radical SAM protein [Candidatus Omnitrophota bacterium]